MTDHQVTLLAAALSTGGPILAVLIGILVNNRQIESVRREIESRFDALSSVLNAKFEAQTQGLLRVEQVMDARLKHLEER